MKVGKEGRGAARIRELRHDLGHREQAGRSEADSPRMNWKTRSPDCDTTNLTHKLNATGQTMADTHFQEFSRIKQIDSGSHWLCALR